MRILWHSAAPWVNTGYGHCTREIVTRLQKRGHDIAVKPLGAVTKGPFWWHGEESPVELDEPIKIYDAGQAFGLDTTTDNFSDFNADLYFTHFDTWIGPARNTIPNMGIPYASYVIVDHYPVPNAVVEQVQNAQRVVAMSQYGKAALREKGTPSRTITHGIDPDVQKPLTGDDKPSVIHTQDESGEIKDVDLDETFVVGMVAANHGDRKHIPGHMEAFKMVLREIDEDAIMYIHTDANPNEGHNLNEVRKEIGLPQENVVWPSNEMYHGISDSMLNKWYNSFDVFVNCSYGESWGMCVTEAMAAGLPVIVSNFSSMPEQITNDDNNLEDITITGPRTYGGIKEADHGIAVDPVVGVFRARVSAKQFIVHPKDIKDAIMYYYNNPDIAHEHGEKAREYAVNNYTWEDHVVPKFDKMFSDMEAELQ